MKSRFLPNLAIAAILISFSLNAAEEPGEKPKTDAKSQKEPLKEETSITKNTVKINGVDVQYTATAGKIILKNDKGEDTAGIFYVSYTKEGVEDNTKRPIMFCFNGGPGSASHMASYWGLRPKKNLFD